MQQIHKMIVLLACLLIVDAARVTEQQYGDLLTAKKYPEAFPLYNGYTIRAYYRTNYTGADYYDNYDWNIAPQITWSYWMDKLNNGQPISLTPIKNPVGKW